MTQAHNVRPARSARSWRRSAYRIREIEPLLSDRHYSVCVLRAVMLFQALPADGSSSGLTGLAALVGISRGSAFRYLQTLRAVGLVEQPAGTRAYRRACPTATRRPKKAR